MSETTRTGREARTDIEASRRQKTLVCASREDSRADTNPVASHSKPADAVEFRVMTDGGRDLKDPSSLSRHDTPAVVHLRGGKEFVAKHDVRDSGWLWVKDWQEQQTLYPPHRIERIERLELTVNEREDRSSPPTYAIVDDDLRERARRLAQPTVEGDDVQEAIADGGQQ